MQRNNMRNIVFVPSRQNKDNMLALAVVILPLFWMKTQLIVDPEGSYLILKEVVTSQGLP